MKLFQRLLTMLMAICLLVSMIPATAGAVENPDVTADSGDMTIESTNSFGHLLSQDLQEEQMQQEEQNAGGYNVIGLTIEGNTAMVEYSSLEEAVLVVALYTEDGLQMRCSGKTTVDPEATEAVVTIEGEIPEYFMAVAYLMDTYDYSPLCEAYSTPMYTKEMQDLLASTVVDYDKDLVLNFDEDETTNFAVFAEDIKIIDYAEGVNTVITADDENATYVIGNADSNITELQPGDIFAYTYGEEQLLIVKVASIEMDGTTAVIVGEDVGMEEVFSHVKMEQVGDAGDIEVDESTCPDNVIYEGKTSDGSSNYTMRAVEGEIQQKEIELKFKITEPNDDEEGDDNVNVSIGLTGTIGVALDIDFSFYVSLSRQFIEFKTDVGFTTSLKFEAAVKGEFPLPKLKFRAYGLGIGFEPEIQFEVKATVEVTFFAGWTIGFSYEHNSHIRGKRDGFHNLTSSPKIDAEFKVEGSIFVGIDLGPVIDFAEGAIIKAEVEVPIGFELTAELKGSNYEVFMPGAECIHDCANCVAMELKFKGEVTAKLRFLNCKRLEISSKPLELSIKIADMYWSIDRNEFRFGETCPHLKYRTTAVVTDQHGDAVAGAEVTAQGDRNGRIISLGKTNEYGIATAYLMPDSYLFSAIVDEDTLSTEYRIREATRVILTASSSMPNSVFPDEIIDHGYVIASGNAGMHSPGDITWTLYSSGLLDVQGVGDMAYGPDWIDYCDQITTAVLADGITSVGSYAFDGCENLTDVTLPTTIKFIDARAFYGCSKLQNLNIPNGVTFIGQGAFQGCSGLRSVTLPNSVKEIWSSAFQDCTALESITIPSRITYIESRMFAGCHNLSEIHIPDGVTSIGDWAFSDCILLTELDIPDQVASIGESAFYGCYNLQSMIIPEGVSSIADSTFSGCNRLTSVSIPDGVTSIDRYAFLDCVSLSEISLPSKLTYIGYGAFEKCSNWSGDIIIPNGVSSIGNWAFNRCSNLNSITLPEGLTSIGQDTFGFCEKLSQINIPASVTMIGKRAFESCKNLTSIRLPEGITSIEDSTFDGCVKLAEINIPESVTSIGKNAFFSCDELAELSIPSGVTNIGQSAFYGCDKLTDIVIPDGIVNINMSTFGYCTNLKSVTIPASVANIGYNAFVACTALSDIYYGGTLEQWNNIQIDSTNSDYLKPATKHFASAEAVISELLLSMPEVDAEETIPEELEIPIDQKVPTLDAVFGGEYETEVTPEYTLKTATFSGLVPGQQYVLLVMASIEAEDVLNAQNLLYIAQKAAEDDGTLVFTYVQKINTDMSYVVACGASNKNLQDALITFPEMTANGEAQLVKPTVAYDGTTLTEGVDYVVVGKTDFIEAGTYICKIRGIRKYTGIVTCEYTVKNGVLLGDVNSDGKVNTQDRTILARYLAKWSDYPESIINMQAADVNCDGKVNTQDRTILARHLAKWTGYETLGG